VTIASDHTGEPLDLLAQAEASKLERRRALLTALSAAPIEPAPDDAALDQLAEAIANKLIAKLTEQVEQ
jgi:hypothetical protein